MKNNFDLILFIIKHCNPEYLFLTITVSLYLIHSLALEINILLEKMIFVVAYVRKKIDLISCFKNILFV